MNGSGRQHPAHGVFDVLGNPTIVFGTICTKDRCPWLANDNVHQILRNVWRGADAWWLGRYVIMPDHIHFFAGFNGHECPFDRWITYWKSQFTKRHIFRDDCRWQTDHWDVRVRNRHAYEAEWTYVAENPVRAGFVSSACDWPYQGSIYRLAWD